MKARFFLAFALLVPLIALVAYGRIGPASSPEYSLEPRVAAQITSADWLHPFRVTSSTFENDAEAPQSMVYNGVLGNTCSGANQSPELSWTRAIPLTRSYAVVAFDVTASFTHWGIYNIPPSTTTLPAGAGVAGSKYGDQIVNDAGYQGYSGPCPPPGLVHQYVFTVYALDTTLSLPSSTKFPANAETLLRALIGHVIESTSITALYSTQ